MDKRSILCMAVLLFFASCSSDIGDRLEGKWQMQQIEADGITLNVDTIFYNFQTSLFMYQIYIPQNDSFSYCYGFKMMETKNQVLLELTNYAVSLNKFLPQTDWGAPARRFIVEELTEKRLVMKDDGKRYTFRRF
ncbi:MAG: lipocalin-like domain-containing protein [Tannerellaceae bacterium]|nr:lipocalin-like domain-containing protein [Tannerellaceae bacterium]